MEAISEEIRHYLHGKILKIYLTKRKKQYLIPKNLKTKYKVKLHKRENSKSDQISTLIHF